MAHFAADGDHREFLKIKAPKDPHRIEGLQFEWRFARHDIGKIKGQHRRSVIERAETNQLGMACGFWQQLVVTRNQVSQLHTVVVGVLAGMKDVAIEKDSFVTERKDGRDSDLVSVCNFELR